MSSTVRRRQGGDDDAPVPALNEVDSDDSAERFLDVGAKEAEETKEYKDPLLKPENKEQVPTVKLSRIDSFLSGYVAFTSSAINQDRGLKLLQWTLWLASTNKSNSPAKRESLYKLYTHLSFVRYALRLFGLPEALEAAKSGSWGSGYKDGKIKALGKIMALSMVAYYPLEHAAYVKWMAPNLFQKSKRASAEKLSAYSCRAWLAYIVAEILQSVFKLKEMHKQRKQLDMDKQNQEDSNGDKEQQLARMTKLDQSIRNERLQIVRNLLFTLPCIHWSLPKWDTDPWLREGVVNGLMWGESLVCIIQSLLKFKAL